MSSEEKSKLILMLQDMVAKANRAAEDKDKENNEILGKLNAVLEGQAASKTQIDELNETIKTLNDTVKKLKK